MVPDDGSYPPDLGATRMLDMMVEAGLVLREEPKVVIPPTTDCEVRFRRPPAVRYWGLAQAAASAARQQRANERAAECQ